MKLRSLTRRRPSASLAVSLAALSVALGGTGWAATQLPPNSVGSAQIKNGAVVNRKLAPNAVGPRKIINDAVGAEQVNASQVQLRVSYSCTTGAITSIGLSGTVVCGPALPGEQGTSSSAVTLGSGSTQIATEALPSGSGYLVLAYPHAVITPAPSASGQQVEVDCTLSVLPNGVSETESLIVEIGSLELPQADTIPLVVPVASVAPGSSAVVSCSDVYSAGMAPTVSVDTTLNAIQTAPDG